MDIWLEIPSPVEAVLPRRVLLPFAHALLIGRNPDADVFLTSLSASRFHCQIERDGCGAWIRDLNSREGTFVNGISVGIGPHRLVPNDTIGVGGILLRIGWDFEADPYWLQWEAGVLVSLAGRVRDEGDRAAMPILADALEEVGCTEADILEHLRGPGPHVRECWVLNLLLGKE